MTKRRKQCPECHELFHPDPRVPKQYTCSNPECQKRRKNKNQANLRKRDRQHRENDHDAKKRFRKRHPEYYKEYRAAHPEYTERNRVLQRQRNKKRRDSLKNARERQGAPPSMVDFAGKPHTQEHEIARNTGVANRVERSAVLLLNEGVKPILNRHSGVAIRIANVDLIYANPKQIHAIRSI